MGTFSVPLRSAWLPFFDLNRITAEITSASADTPYKPQPSVGDVRE